MQNEKCKLNNSGIFNFQFSIFNSRRDGFTLIEVLVAFSILSIILVAVYSTFFLSRKAMDGVDDSIVRLQECRMIVDVMRREIEAAVYNESSKGAVFKVEDRDIYGKQASRFTFTCLSPLTPGLSLISYSMEERDGKPAILKRISAPYKPDSKDKGTVLADDIEAFTVEVKNGNQWIKTWDALDTKKVPGELRITITVLLKGRRVPVSEIVTPRIGKAL